MQKIKKKIKMLKMLKNKRIKKIKKIKKIKRANLKHKITKTTLQLNLKKANKEKVLKIIIKLNQNSFLIFERKNWIRTHGIK